MTETVESDCEWKAPSLDEVDERPVDVLVIGGGIVGAGVARDAALRGFRTLLVEQADFASGTSSRSSRLLHGGMRYLAQGRIGLVYEASREKRVLGRIAPHLAQPLAFIFPGRKGTFWPRWKLAIGAKLYDLLCGMRNFGGSDVLSRGEIMRLLPGLCDRNLTGAVRYFDALTNDARLVLDTLRSAAQHGAAVFNYVRLTQAESDGNIWRCELVDVRSDKQYVVGARTVVNAAGPWSDKLPNSKTSLRLTKGVHLVIDRDRLPIPDAVVMAEGERILFAIPWGERVILGTTDTDYDGPLDHPVCDEADIRYVLGVVNDTFPRASLSAADIVSTWAGLRPLVADLRGKPSDISRRHEVKMTHSGWWDVTGGKLTTYRLMAQETVSAIAGYTNHAEAKCRTAELPLLKPSEVGTRSGILPPPISRTVVEFYCRSEWARHLDDVMIRRTSWQHYHHDDLAVATRTARWMAAALGWGEATVQAEIARYCQLAGRIGVGAPYVQVEGRAATAASFAGQ
jgi:glycerol-3-phosphate dehydrogenase